MFNTDLLLENLKRLVSAPSISGTKEEILGAYKIKEILMEVPYFQKHPENVQLVPIENDPFDRVLAVGFLEGDPKCKDTVILTGHYDVVDIEEFGKLQDIAYDMNEITKRINELPLSDEVRKDYESGEWFFGRGCLDMKYGHAISIELLRHYSEAGIKGNLLYVAVCGEETNSEGMLAAVPFFMNFAKEKGLTYKNLLLTEGYMVDGQKEDTRYIQYGAAGKVMPLFFCVGKTTHGEEPLLGMDANILASEVYREMVVNPKFCQKNHGITSAPPAGLKLQDLKVNYSLSTSLFSACYFNIATIKMNPEELMTQLRGVAEKAYENAIELMDRKAKGFAEISGREPEYYHASPCVMTYKEIFDAVEKTYDGDLKAHIKEVTMEYMKENPEMQATCIKVLRHLYDLYEDKKSMIIVACMPPYYPDVNVDVNEPETAKMLSLIDELMEYAKEKHGVKMETSEYYGISDLCYTWLAEGMDFEALFENLIGVGTMYQFPAEALKEFKVPGLVLGCYGKDMHKYTERLAKFYNFDVLPDLYMHLIDNILK